MSPTTQPVLDLLRALLPTIVGIPSSLLVAICTAVLTVPLSLRRFQAERWWELKAEAYSKIVAALYTAIDYWSTLRDETMEMRTASDEEQKRRNKDAGEALQEIRKAAAVGAYFISIESAQILDSLIKKPRKTWQQQQDEAPWDHFDENRQEFEAALTALRQAAKRDLRVG